MKQPTNEAPWTAEHGPWTIKWSGGRLADVYHAESPTAQDCVQVCEYDWQKGEVAEELRPDQLHDVLVRWAEDYGRDHAANLA